MEKSSIGVFSISAMIRAMATAPLPKIDYAGIGRRLDALRAATGMDKGDFADVSSIDRSSYSKIIKGAKPLKFEMAYAVSEKWGVPMDYLYRGSLDKIEPTLAKAIIKHLNDRNE